MASLNMPDGAFESWSYDGAGNQTGYVNPLGQTTLYGFDDAGRATLVDYPTGTDTTLAYDAADRQTSMTDATGTTSWAYDNANRSTTFTSPQGAQTSGYDDAGQRTTLTGTGISRTWTYDDAGRTASLLNESAETTTFQYDTVGRLSRQTEANQNTQYAYDARGRTTQVKNAGNGGTTQIQQDYVYDDAGNLSSKAQTQFQVAGTLTTTYGYDLADQLASESSPGTAASYTYDANGNRASKTLNGTTQTYAVDDGDKLTSITQGASTVKSYTYDAAGRTKTVVSSAGTTTLSYDYESRVTSIAGPGVSNTYTYNGLDTRVGKVDSTGTATYRRDGADVTDDVLSDGAAVYTPGVGQRRGGNTLIDRPDRLGTSLMQTSGLAAQQATRSYDAFGVLTASTGTPRGRSASRKDPRRKSLALDDASVDDPRSPSLLGEVARCVSTLPSLRPYLYKKYVDRSSGLHISFPGADVLKHLGLENPKVTLLPLRDSEKADIVVEYLRSQRGSYDVRAGFDAEGVVILMRLSHEAKRLTVRASSVVEL